MIVHALLNWFRHDYHPKVARARRPTLRSRRAMLLERLEPRVVLAADIVISELLASNAYGLLDYDDDDSDWLEVHNRESTSVDLEGWHLTDRADNLTKWRFPVSTVLALGERLVVFASAKDFVARNGELHANFKLSSDGEFLALVDPAGVLVHSVSPEFPPQATDVSYGLDESTAGTNAFAFFATPTPGAPNADPFDGFLQPPTFSVISQSFSDELSVELTTIEAEAAVRYTADGTVPDGFSMLYTDPLTISTSAQIRARVFRDGFVPSETVSESYVKLAEDAPNISSNLPIVVIENFEQGTPSDKIWRNAFLAVFEPDETGRSRLTGPADLTSRIGWHRRGRSTLQNPKWNLRIEMRDELDGDRAVELLGLPRESDFILYAPFSFDRALMRNAFIFGLSNQIGRYAPRTRFVELYANVNDGELSEGDYMGVYVLEENIKADGNRVDIERLSTKYDSEPEITGGYIFKVDSSNGPDDEFSTTGRFYVLVEPNHVGITPAQRAYISGYVDDLERALISRNFTDPVLGYRAFLNVDPTIDHHILRFLTNIVDHFNLSTHLVKDRNGKVEYGPIWDHDRSMGSDGGGDGGPSDSNTFLRFFTTHWFNRLFQDPDFAHAWVDRWTDLRKTFFSIENTHAIIDGMAAEIAEAQARNFERWPSVAPNGGEFAESGLTGWEAEVSHMKGWLERRLEWIDSLLVAPVSFSSESGTVHSGFEVTLSAPASAIYYTLDGTDPLASGGQPGPQAIQYDGGPIVIDDTTTIIARALDPNTRLPWTWSGASSVEFSVSSELAIPGDANRDGQFNQCDIQDVLAAGKFETGLPATWEEGDWNADGLFTFDDVLSALATGAYVDDCTGKTAATAAGEGHLPPVRGLKTGRSRTPSSQMALRGTSPSDNTSPTRERGTLPIVVPIESLGSFPRSRVGLVWNVRSRTPPSDYADDYFSQLGEGPASPLYVRIATTSSRAHASRQQLAEKAASDVLLAISYPQLEGHHPLANVVSQAVDIGRSRKISR